MPTRPEKPPHTPAPPAAIGSKPAAAPRLRLPRAPHLLLILLALAQLTAPLLAAETPSTASTVLTAAFPAAAALNPSAPAPTPAPTAAATASPAARSPAALPGSPPLHPPAAKKHPAASPPEPPTPPTPPAPPLDLPTAGRMLRPGEVLIVTPGENLTVESPAEPDRLAPMLDAATGEVAWVRLPGHPRAVAAIRWLDASNIKKLVEIEMLEGDLFVAAAPREQKDHSLAIRGRKRGEIFATPAGWKALDNRALKVHFEVDASLQVVGFGDPLLPGNADPALTAGLHIFASLRPGSLVQNAGDTTLVLEQYSTAGDPTHRVILPPETALVTNGGEFDLKHFYIPEPGQPGGPELLHHVGVDPFFDLEPEGGAGGENGGHVGRGAEARPGVLP